MLTLVLSIMMQQSFSQCTGVLPQTADRVARPSTVNDPTCTIYTNLIGTTRNTGFDIYKDGSNVNCRVMVWDGTLASLSWDYGNIRNNIKFEDLKTQIGGSLPTLEDPDVVVHELAGTVYAMLVGIAKNTTSNDNKVFWASFGWDATNTAFVYNTSGFVGTNADGAKCANPNIDVNACGVVAITWHKEYIDTITFTTTGSSNVNFTNYDQAVLRADIYAAYGLLNGSGCNGVISGTGGTLLGDLISTASGVDHLFEMNVTPDVCISDRTVTSCTDFNVTFTWQQSWFDPAEFTTFRGVAVKQYNCDFNSSGCITGSSSNYYRLLDFWGQSGRPRIAARPTANTTVTQYTDFQIVMAYYNIGCSIDTSGCPATCSIYSSSGVLNWGRHGGNDVNGTPYTAINLTATTNGVSPCDLDDFYNNNAVVSYLNKGFGTAGNYAVAWEHGPNPVTCANGISNTTDIDIVARTYHDGTDITAAPDFSIVNNHICSSNQDDNQLIPSIGGRHAGQQMGFAFWEQQAGRYFIAYKTSHSAVVPGSGTAGLRTGNQGAGTDTGEENYKSDFSASPNPFSNEITFTYSLPGNETPIAIEIYDTKGHKIEQINLDGAPKAKTISLNLSSGVYVAKLKTPSGELVTKLTKTE